MKKSIIYSVAIMMSAASLVSCNDFLDAQNKSAGESVNEHFSNAQGVKEARAYAFNALKSITANYELNCAGTDLYIKVRGGDPGDCHRYALNAENSSVTSFYKNSMAAVQAAQFYKSIAADGSQDNAESRFLVDYIYYGMTQQFGGVPYIDHYVQDASRNYPRASVDSIYDVSIKDLQDIYNANVLPETAHDGSVSKQAVATLIAKYYLAKAWDVDTRLNDASKGTYTVTSTENFQNAAQWAVKAINGQALSETFEQKWAPSNEGNFEQIWSVQYEKTGYPGDASKGGHGLQSMFGDYYGPSTQSGYKRVGSNGAQSEKALYLWDRDDDRYEGTFMTKFYNAKKTEDGSSFVWPKTGYYAYYNCTSAELASLPYGLRYFPAYTTTSEAEAEFKANKDKYKQGDYANQIIAYILSVPAYRYTFDANGNYKREKVSFTELCNAVNGGTTVKKWDDPNTDLLEDISKNDYRDIVVFDLSDVYLMASEAYLMAGNTAESLRYLNAVRTRANAKALNSFAEYEPSYTVPASFGEVTPLDVILDERARELYGQFYRWEELRRTKQLVRYNIAFNDYISSAADMSNNKGEIKWLRPIPADAINGNYGLTLEDQNPGY